LITDSELHILDTYEGFPRIYNSIGINAYLDEKHNVYAFTYVMTPKAIKDRKHLPYPMGYRLICSHGARVHGVKDSFGKPDDPPYRAPCGAFTMREKPSRDSSHLKDGEA
jgi:hypothetical protein